MQIKISQSTSQVECSIANRFIHHYIIFLGYIIWQEQVTYIIIGQQNSKQIFINDFRLLLS